MRSVAAFSVVDACRRDNSGGSPTVVLAEGPFSEDERRAIPVRTGVSHAAFVSPSGAVRFFTSEGELPACGHGTVAVLAVLAQRTGRADHVLHISGHARRGRAARIGDGRFDAAFEPGPITLSPATSDLSEICASLGVPPRLPMCVATLGRPRLLVPVADRRILAALRPDLDRLRTATRAAGLLGCYVYTLPDDGRCAARMFAPAIGVPEDIANANSTACLAAHLARPISVDMGDSVGHPATVTARPGLVGGVAAIRS